MEFEVLTELKITPIIKKNDPITLKSFRVSCMSDNPGKNNLNFIGVMFLKCPEDAKTVHGHSLLPGYIHLKSPSNLKKPRDQIALHAQCFESICGHGSYKNKSHDYLVLGFGLYYNAGPYSFESALNNGMLSLTSGTFNQRLNEYIGIGNNLRDGREVAAEVFTPILQVIMRKYKLETRVGFTLKLEHIPFAIYKTHLEVYNFISFETRKIKFESSNEFCQWCRQFYENEYNRLTDFKDWFLKGEYNHDDLDQFRNFIICRESLIRIFNHD